MGDIVKGDKIVFGNNSRMIKIEIKNNFGSAPDREADDVSEPAIVEAEDAEFEEVNDGSGSESNIGGDDDALAMVKKCFKFTSEFAREKVKKIMEDYYHNSNPNLALIEITLYDHDMLWNRNDHKPFLEALAAWGLLEIANDDVMEVMLSSMRHKYSTLPKEGGYNSWGPKFQNEKNTCINIGNELGETMPYRYKNEEKTS